MKCSIFLVVVSSIAKVTCINEEIKCPDLCKCDKFERLKRVQCTRLNLLNIGPDIPTKVEVLDLCFNQISTLVDHEFSNLNLRSMKLLNMSHNKIGHMHMNAFQNLQNIKTIDLSFNAIEYILPEWFSDIVSLTELYLSNNNFAALSNGPHIRSKSLEVLDISSCRIPYIKVDTFMELGNLKSLRINGNSLIQLNVKSLHYLKNLQIIALEDNQWHCDDAMMRLINYLRNKGVRFKDPCKKAELLATEEMFQRIVNLDVDEFDENKNSWIHDTTEDYLNRSTVCNCSTDTHTEKIGILLEIINMSPILSITIPFVVGLVMGLIFACSLEQVKHNTKHNPRKRFSVIKKGGCSINEHTCPLVLNDEHISDTTPVSKRRRESFQLYALNSRINNRVSFVMSKNRSSKYRMNQKY